MLTFRSAVAAALALAASLASGPARADNVDDDDLIRPKRLTVGVADDLLGQLGPDGNTLYFVSNRDTTNQLFVQNLVDGRAHQLFDDGADVTWPRVSPDGRSLLYISFRDSANGQLCIRRLPQGEGRRCLDDPAAALQAEWIDPQRIALVSRKSIRGDLSVLEVTAGASLSSRPLLDRNMTSPAVSPDGRWLVYVPVARTVDTVGPAFAAHAAQALEAIPLASVASAASATPLKIVLPLPGQTGQPVFARDGRSLYVVQFFADTNRDGAIDASDHGVLFRVPLDLTTGAAVVGAPEQLTETSWNCEYPSPFVDRLIATCSQDASLDVYSLSLDGEVPASWTMPQLANAIDDADTLVEEQLLTSRRLSRETTPAARRLAMLALVMVHLEHEEFPAAQFYAEQVDALRDEATAGISLPLRMLVEQRRADRRREQGKLMEGFRHDAHDRLDKLHAQGAGSPMAEDLTHLARSEIFGSLGDETHARNELEAVTVDETTPVPIVEAYYRQADALYRQLDDREALVTTCRRLSGSAGLKPDEQLHYARAAVRAMVRGLPWADADARLARERSGVLPGESELAFAIDLARDVLAIRDAHPPQAIGDALLSLYAAQTRPGRRRALVVEAVQRADDADADDVLDALVQRDIHDVKRGTHERGEAEDVYERLILARAYERAAAKQLDGARDDFEAVTEQTGSLEAVVGAIDMRLKKGESPAAIAARYAAPGTPAARARFATAYLDARQLPKLEGDAHERVAAEAKAALDASWSDLKEERMAQALFGALPSRGVPADRRARRGRAGQRALPGRAGARRRKRPAAGDDPGRAGPPAHGRGKLPDRARVPARARQAPLRRQRRGARRAAVEGPGAVARGPRGGRGGGGGSCARDDRTQPGARRLPPPRPRLDRARQPRGGELRARSGALRRRDRAARRRARRSPGGAQPRRGAGLESGGCDWREAAHPRARRSRLRGRAPGRREHGFHPRVAAHHGRPCGARLPPDHERPARERQPGAGSSGPGGAGRGRPAKHPRRAAPGDPARRGRAPADAHRRAAGAQRGATPRRGRRGRLARSGPDASRRSARTRQRGQRQGAARRTVAGCGAAPCRWGARSWPICRSASTPRWARWPRDASRLCGPTRAGSRSTRLSCSGLGPGPNASRARSRALPWARARTPSPSPRGSAAGSASHARAPRTPRAAPRLR